MTFFENRAVYETMWKNKCRAGQATDDNMSHAYSSGRFHTKLTRTKTETNQKENRTETKLKQK